MHRDQDLRTFRILTITFIITSNKMPRHRTTVSKALKVGIPAFTQAILKNAKPTLPRLWNAKRRIKSGRILAVKGERADKNRGLAIVQNDRDSQAWKKLVSEDVVKFIEDAKLSPSERRRCVANPNAFFAYPNNVPNALRKQVYLYVSFQCTLTMLSLTIQKSQFYDHP